MKHRLLRSATFWTVFATLTYLGGLGMHASHAGQAPRIMCSEFFRWISNNNVSELANYLNKGGAVPFEGVLCDNESFFFWNVNALHYSAAHHQSVIIDLLLNKSSINVNAQIREDGVKKLPADFVPGDTALHIAIRKNDLEVIKVLSQRGDLDPDQANSKNQTSYQLAIQLGNKAILDLLHQFDQRIFSEGSDKTDCFDSNLLEARYALIKKHYSGTDLEIIPKLIYANKATELALFLRHSKIAPDKNYFDVKNASLNYVYTTTKSSLLHFLAAEGKCSLLKMVLTNPNIDPNVESDYFKESPLLIAASENHGECIEALLAHPRIKVDVRSTPATLGFASKKRDFLTQKIGYYFSLTPLMVAAVKGNADAFKALWNDSKIDRDARALKCKVKTSEDDQEYLSSLTRDEGAFLDRRECVTPKEPGPTAAEVALFFHQKAILSISGRPH